MLVFRNSTDTKTEAKAGEKKKRGRPSQAHSAAASAAPRAAAPAPAAAAAPTPKPSAPRAAAPVVSGGFSLDEIKEQRKAYRKQVIAAYAKYEGEEKLKRLRKDAKDLELTGVSKMGVKDLLAAVVKAEVDATYPLPVKPPKNERAQTRRDIQEEINKMDRKELLEEAKRLKIPSYSKLTTEELRPAIVRAEMKVEFPAKRKAPSVRASRKGIAPSTATRLKISEKHKTKGGRRAGVGIYRVAVLVNGNFDPSRGADLGPYATARAAAIDAKTLLRTAARVEDHRISQKMALDMIDEGDESLTEFKEAGLGEVVDGFIVDGTVNGRSWEAWVYRVSNRQPATSRALLDNVLPAGERVQSMVLRANSRRNAGKVSFRTRDGRTVSFRARK